MWMRFSNRNFPVEIARDCRLLNSFRSYSNMEIESNWILINYEED